MTYLALTYAYDLCLIGDRTKENVRRILQPLPELGIAGKLTVLRAGQQHVATDCRGRTFSKHGVITSRNEWISGDSSYQK